MKNLNQSGFQPAYTMPCCTMPKMNAPIAAPIAVPYAGQQAAPDHRGDDVDELVAHPLTRLHGIEREQQMHPGEPGTKPDKHEQPDLHRGHRHTHRPRTFLIPTHGEDPVADP